MKPIHKLLAGSILAAGTLLGSAAGVAAASADPAAAPPPPAWHHHGPEHMLASLGLSAEQKASIRTIMTGAEPQMQSLREQMRANALKLMQTQPSDANYGSVASQVSQANGALHAQITLQRADIRAQVFKVLTPAQQQQLAALEVQREQRMAAHKDAFGPHGRGGPPPLDE